MRKAAVAARRAVSRLRRGPTRPEGPSTPLQPRRTGASIRERLRSDLGRLAAAGRAAASTPGPRPLRRGPDAHRAGTRRLDALLRLASTPRVAAAFRDALRTGSGRWLPAAIGCLILVASLLSAAPVVSSHGGIGAVNGPGTAPRIAIGGMDAPGLATGEVDGLSSAVDPATLGAAGMLDAGTSTGLGAAYAGETYSANEAARVEAAITAGSAGGAGGPFLEDGTLLKPLAVDTTVPDGSANLKTYIVRDGDTLTGIANRFGISMMTIWWANDLRTKDELHVGQKLVIPPVTGVVVEVAPGDTLESIAADAKVSPDVIVNYNHLADRTVIIGQTLIIPGGVGDPIPTPSTPTPAPRSGGSSGGSSGGTTQPTNPPRSYTGGRFAWPVVGGGNYISQYFHYSHQAIDIAADYGSPVVAAASGVVIFAGWKNNGGGYQVWISHGNNLYTDYNHMSGLTVGVGQHVGAGQQVGRIGATGDATGPHLHFDVWIGMIWGSGSYRVNPLRYF